MTAAAAARRATEELLLLGSEDGAATFLPSDLSGLELWLDATVGVDTDVDGVFSWADQSGNDRKFTQDTGPAKPDLTAGFQNGLPAIEFDGVDDKLTRADILVVAPGFSIFIVCGGADLDYFMGESSTDLLQRNAANSPRFKANNTDNSFDAVWDDSAVHLLEFHADGTTDLECVYDGVTAGTISEGDEPWDMTTVGSYRIPAGGESAVDICELFIYSSEKTGSDRTDARDYLKSKWATP